MFFAGMPRTPPQPLQRYSDSPMVEVIMPKMGDAMEEGTLLEWLKKEGDSVKSGEPVASIQTDKATVEMEAPSSGTLSGILVQAGDTVPVGKAIAAILNSGEKLPSGWGGDGKASPVKPAKEPSKQDAKEEPAAKEDKKESQETAQAEPATQPSENGARVKASPLAKKIAGELGVDLATVSGSGPGGRIVEKDVRAAAEKGALPAAAARATQVQAEDREVPLNKLRQITAQRTQQSKQEAPHFYVTVEVDVENLLALRSIYERDGLEKPSVNDFVIKACALALREMPVVNSVYKGDKLLQLGNVNIGMAVALEDGLTLPVLHNADRLSIPEISALSKELAAKAKGNKLAPEELSGSTFSISNMGMLNVDVFAAILNPPNAAILAVGTAKRKAVVDEETGEIVARTRMYVTGSFDHRVVDGAVGAKFVNLVREHLEKPARLL
jgi:pyruvate dehydrogenase E2 component (dihydrolipoamide acetyltransferase)